MEQQKFEESFKETFSGAEMEPSASVWTNVELDLDRSSEKKGLLILIQLLAAASIVFAMGIGGVYYLDNAQFENVQSAAVNNTTSDDSDKINSQEPAISISAPTTFENPKVKAQSNSSEQPTKNLTEVATSLPIVALINDDDLKGEVRNATVELFQRQRPLPKLSKVLQPTLIISTATEPDAGMLLLARLQDEERKYQQAEAVVNEKMWTSVGVGAGTFYPNTNSSSLSLQGFDNIASSSNPSAGTSYSAGVSVAGKISRRIVLQGGITYLSYNAEYTSSAALGTKASLNEFIVSNEQLVATSPYKVNSNLQYMSIPIQAGFILLERNFALQLNTGISTDIFLQNTLTPENSGLGKVTQSAGSDSPYRTINFSGLVSAELSYKVGDHYRIAVNPGLRYVLNSIYRSEVPSQIAPVSVDLALRFRYIF